MPLPTPVLPSFSRCISVSKISALVLPGELGGARRQLLDRLLLAVHFERRNDRVRRDKIGERHCNRSGMKWVWLLMGRRRFIGTAPCGVNGPN